MSRHPIERDALAEMESRALNEPRSKPTERPPTNAEVAYDLEARARKLDELSRQLAREASDMAFAAKRIRERA